jgi:hypothetical protein
MALAIQTDPVSDYKSETGNEEAPRRLSCIGCGNHLKPIRHSQDSTGDWVIRSRCPNCGLNHVHRRKYPPPV